MFLALYKGNKKSLTQQVLHESPEKKPYSGRHCGRSSSPAPSGFSRKLLGVHRWSGCAAHPRMGGRGWGA